MHSNRALPSNGFTLLELVFGLGVVAVLSAVSLPLYLRYVERAELARLLTQIDQISTAVHRLRTPPASRHCNKEQCQARSPRACAWCRTVPSASQAVSGSRRSGPQLVFLHRRPTRSGMAW